MLGGDTTLQTWMIAVTSSMSINQNVYINYTCSMKVCWRYVLPNANTGHFCDIFSDIGQCCCVRKTSRCFYMEKPRRRHNIFAASRKKILNPNGTYINMFQIILRNVCLSVICLWSVVRLQPTPAYVEIFTKSKVHYFSLS